VTEVTKDSQVYDTKEELASKLLATAVKIRNEGTSEALKNGYFAFLPLPIFVTILVATEK